MFDNIKNANNITNVQINFSLNGLVFCSGVCTSGMFPNTVSKIFGIKNLNLLEVYKVIGIKFNIHILIIKMFDFSK